MESGYQISILSVMRHSIIFIRTFMAMTYSFFLFSNRSKQHITTIASITHIKISKGSQFLKPVAIKPITSPNNGKKSPSNEANLIFLINNTPIVK